MSVYLFVFLVFPLAYQKKTTGPNFSKISIVAVAQNSSDGNAICCVLGLHLVFI